MLTGTLAVAPRILRYMAEREREGDRKFLAVTEDIEDITLLCTLLLKVKIFSIGLPFRVCGSEFPYTE